MSDMTLRKLAKMSHRQIREWVRDNSDSHEIVERVASTCGNCRYNKDSRCMMTNYEVEAKQRPCEGWTER